MNVLKTKRQFASLYRKIAKRLETGEGVLKDGSTGDAGKCGGASGCIYGQAWAVAGIREDLFYNDEFDSHINMFWCGSKNRLMTKALKKEIHAQLKADGVFLDSDVLLAGVNDDLISRRGTKFATKFFIKTLRAAARSLDHGGLL